MVAETSEAGCEQEDEGDNSEREVFGRVETQMIWEQAGCIREGRLVRVVLRI